MSKLSSPLASQYKKRLALTMASFAFISFGFLSILTSPAVDLNSIIKALVKSFPGMLTLGFLGYLLGGIFDNRHAVKKRPVFQADNTADFPENPMFAASNGADSDDEDGTEGANETQL